MTQGAHITLGCGDLHPKDGVPVLLQCQAVPTKVGHPIPRTLVAVEVEGEAAQVLPGVSGEYQLPTGVPCCQQGCVPQRRGQGVSPKNTWGGGRRRDESPALLHSTPHPLSKGWNS